MLRRKSDDFPMMTLRMVRWISFSNVIPLSSCTLRKTFKQNTVRQYSCHENNSQNSSNIRATALQLMALEGRSSQDDCEEKLSYLDENFLLGAYLKTPYSIA